jgi:hypothetical protein
LPATRPYRQVPFQFSLHRLSRTGTLSHIGFLRYFSFVTDLTSWRQGEVPAGDLLDRATAVYGKGAGRAASNVDIMCAAFDAWVNQSVPALFARLFTVEAPVDSSANPRPVRLFGAPGTMETDLFAALPPLLTGRAVAPLRLAACSAPACRHRAPGARHAGRPRAPSRVAQRLGGF